MGGKAVRSRDEIQSWATSEAGRREVTQVVEESKAKRQSLAERSKVSLEAMRRPVTIR